jgi:phosphoesterase RecJ-like protein
MEAVIRALSGGRSFVVPLHLEPDGDSVGASIALSLVLQASGRRSVVVSHDPMPPAYQFLPGTAAVLRLEHWDGSGDVVVMVDAGEPSRYGIERSWLSGKVVINIDHHLTNDGFGDVWWVDRSAAAASEMVHSIIKGLGAGITKPVATLLYTGILTDTGSFRFDNTSSSCLLAASELVQLGAEPAQLAKRVFETRSLSSLRLVGRALTRLDVDGSGKVAWTVITRKMIEETGSQDSEAEGVVSFTRMIPGVEVGIIFKEVDGSLVRVGLRSKDCVDVSMLASRHGGGGHARAAGFCYHGSLERAVEEIVREASESAQREHSATAPGLPGAGAEV